MLTTKTPITIHLVGKCIAHQANDFANPEYTQHCTQCGKLLSTDIFGYPTGAKIAEDTHFIAMYIGDLEPNCEAA